MMKNAVLDCGWGRLIFGHTFDDPQALADVLCQEEPDKRDIAFYISDPHVVLSLAPQELFLDPSHTYRLWLERYRGAARRRGGFTILPIESAADAKALETVYARCGMVGPPPAFVGARCGSDALSYFIAVSRDSGDIIGCVHGVDHVAAFGDPENGSSLWSLAVDPQTPHKGVGEALARHLAEHYRARGRAFMDLSVLHDNEAAIALYEKLGFERVPVFCVKHKNPINEPLFSGSNDDEGLNPYARIIVNEARRRGIAVEVLDAEEGYFRLTFGGRSLICRESLSELTTAIAMSRCDNKAVTRRVLLGAGLRLPDQRPASDDAADEEFLHRHGRIVVKVAQGEQGKGVFVDIRTVEEMRRAIAAARTMCPRVLLEQMVEGQDLRIVVIDHEVVAAAIRRPAEVIGDGRSSIRDLIAVQSRRRAQATGGESRIPMDEETERCVRAAGHDLDAVLEAGEVLQVRKSANLHTGGTIHDVTPLLHPVLREAAEEASSALDIPVVGLDFMVADLSRPDYVIIEANERPGLANHEPQPTAERFVDLLFPQTIRRQRRA
jgi:GNAT-family acetyltransferase (TIGR03103 family)